MARASCYFLPALRAAGQGSDDVTNRATLLRGVDQMKRAPAKVRREPRKAKTAGRCNDSQAALALEVAGSVVVRPAALWRCAAFRPARLLLLLHPSRSGEFNGTPGKKKRRNRQRAENRAVVYRRPFPAKSPCEPPPRRTRSLALDDDSPDLSPGPYGTQTYTAPLLKQRRKKEDTEANDELLHAGVSESPPLVVNTYRLYNAIAQERRSTKRLHRAET
ncbi:hypothetical protein MRX96_038007 [Rhipicephalus microplus]